MEPDDWVEMAVDRPPGEALIVFYVPLARYIWGCGLDYDQIKAEYPAVTHWRIAMREPGKK
jgi:hypothetical protein